MRENIFTYGTLKRRDASGMHRLLGDCEFLGQGRVQGMLFKNTEYPALKYDAEAWTAGEVYEVDPAVLRAVDDYEGDAYERKKTQVILFEGGVIEAWVYFYAAGET